jgi:hypothetical protein
MQPFFIHAYIQLHTPEYKQTDYAVWIDKQSYS